MISKSSLMNSNKYWCLNEKKVDMFDKEIYF